MYNGADFIKNTLDSISEAYNYNREIKNSVEIIISDNSSTDNTAEIIKNYSKDRLSLKYHVNSFNLGYNKNLDQLVSLSQAKYLWFFACGELMKPDALYNLLSNLQEYTVDNVLLGFDVYEEALDLHINESVYKIINSKLLRERNNFSFPRYQMAITGNVILSEKWKKFINKNLETKYWGHLERILDMIGDSDGSSTLVLPGVFFTLFRDKGGWWTRKDVNLLLVTLDHLSLIESMLDKGFDENLVKKLIKKETGISFFGAAINALSYGYVVTPEKIIEIKKYKKFHPVFNFLIIASLSLPKKSLFWSKIVYGILLFFNKRKVGV